jgi:hypothetical protein
MEKEESCLKESKLKSCRVENSFKWPRIAPILSFYWGEKSGKSSLSNDNSSTYGAAFRGI